MAKREYILREEALSHPFANGKYDHENASIDFILGHESYEEWLEALSAFTEQDIVKPYLEKLKAEIGKSKTEHEMQIAERDIKAKLLISHIYCDIVNILDKYKAESEDKE